MPGRRAPNGTSRRTFVKSAAATAGLFTIVPRHVLGGPGHTPPSEKLNIAGIGIGGKGAGDLRGVESENIVALCDVDSRYAGGTFKRYPEAKRYTDYRVMLDELEEIDAIVVATPDHLHAPISLHAMKLGKHVYCQKPLTQTVRQAQLMAAAAKEHGVATQMGNQGQASEATRRLAEYLSSGVIGDVTEVHIWTDRPMRGAFGVYWPQGVERPADAEAVPDTLDWDLWLGPAAERPYHSSYHPFRWRGWLDFGTGALGDIGCHSIDPVFRALKLDYPTSISASSSRVNDETFPVASTVHYQFPERDGLGPVRLTWYDGGLKPRRPDALEAGREMGTGGTLIVGTEGEMLDGRLIPESRMEELEALPRSLPRSPGHYVEWLDACKGGATPGSDFRFAGRLTEVVLLGNIALRPELRERLMRTDLRWDGQTGQFTNVPEANEFLDRTYCAGWEL